MSRVKNRQVRMITHEYLVELPGNRRDIYDALSFAERDMKEKGLDPTFDDALRITADDEHVIVSWVEKATV